MTEPRRVVIVIFPDVQPLDAVGPAEVFRTAALIDPPGYTVELVAANPGTLRSTTVSLGVDHSIAGCRGPIDTLIVAGGTGDPAGEREPAAGLVGAGRSEALAARVLGLHRRVPARARPACWTAGAPRPTGRACDALASGTRR